MKSPVSDSDMTIHTRPATLHLRGEPFDLVYEYYLDSKTGQEFVTPEMGDRNLMQVYSQYNAKYGTNLPENI